MRIKQLSWGVGVSVLYLLTHLYHLTILPVFADEAIYIRWAQLITDDWWRYLFFPMNDGKTPLFIWLLTPWQWLPIDQLWSARAVSVVVGLVQVGLIGWLTKLLGGRPKTVLLSMGLTTILPFWFFHHRMALMDGLLTVWLTLLLIALTQLRQHLSHTPQRRWWTVVAGVSFGLALWTKLPALLFLPVFFWWLWDEHLSWKKRRQLVLWHGLAFGLGLVLFASLRVSAAFGQLFSRGGDFLYPVGEVVLKGQWQHTLINVPTYISYFWHYLTWPIFLLCLASPFAKRHQRTHHLLWLSALSFIGPIALLGKVVYPRYFLPAVPFFTISATLILEEFTDRLIVLPKDLRRKIIGCFVIIPLLAQTVTLSSLFIATSLTNPSTTPFVTADRSQYLAEWSSGHGLTETASLIRDYRAQNQTVAVATEGFFGSLPDGLNIYFHRRDVTGIYIEGIGQPVRAIPDSFITKAQHYDQVLLVVNSHRYFLDLPREAKKAEYCRIPGAPCLQVWDISSLVRR